MKKVGGLVAKAKGAASHVKDAVESKARDLNEKMSSDPTKKVCERELELGKCDIPGCMHIHPSKIQCKYFAAGFCRTGLRCPYLHGKPDPNPCIRIRHDKSKVRQMIQSMRLLSRRDPFPCKADDTSGITDEELAARAIRLKRAQAALAAFAGVGEDKAHLMPEVAVCLSGGGWRAMMSSAAFLDAINQAGFLDGVTYCAGVSGGSWCLAQWLSVEAAAFGDFGGRYPNVFHDTIPDPWETGTPDNFDAEKHRYERLKKMVHPDTTKHSTKLMGKVMGSIPAALLQGEGFLLKRLVGGENEGFTCRWSKFIAGTMVNQELAGHNPSHFNDITVAPLKKRMQEGTIPLLLCAAVADSRVDKDSRYDWVEMSPFGARRLGNHQFRVHSPVDWLWTDIHDKKRLYPLRLHEMMAICGSAFAFDAKTAVEGGGPDTWLGSVASSIVGQRPLLGGDTRAVIHDPLDPDEFNTKEFGVLRDAGIDINLPFPLVGRGSGRNPQVIVAMDAGEGAHGPVDLKKAVMKGYINLNEKDPRLHENKDEVVQVFMPPPDAANAPIIVYFLGFTSGSTMKVESSEEDIDRRATLVRKYVSEQLVRALQAVCKSFTAKKPPVAVDTTGARSEVTYWTKADLENHRNENAAKYLQINQVLLDDVVEMLYANGTDKVDAWIVEELFAAFAGVEQEGQPTVYPADVFEAFAFLEKKCIGIDSPEFLFFLGETAANRVHWEWDQPFAPPANVGPERFDGCRFFVRRGDNSYAFTHSVVVSYFAARHLSMSFMKHHAVDYFGQLAGPLTDLEGHFKKYQEAWGGLDGTVTLSDKFRFLLCSIGSVCRMVLESFGDEFVANAFIKALSQLFQKSDQQAEQGREDVSVLISVLNCMGKTKTKKFLHEEIKNPTVELKMHVAIASTECGNLAALKWSRVTDVASPNAMKHRTIAMYLTEARKNPSKLPDSDGEETTPAAN